MIFIVLIGRIGTIEDPILGTIIYSLLREPLSDFGMVFNSLRRDRCIVILRAPQGICVIITKKYDKRFFPVQRM